MSAGKMQTKVQPEKEKQLSADWINREQPDHMKYFFRKDQAEASASIPGLKQCIWLQTHDLTVNKISS